MSEVTWTSSELPQRRWFLDAAAGARAASSGAEAGCRLERAMMLAYSASLTME